MLCIWGVCVPDLSLVFLMGGILIAISDMVNPLCVIHIHRMDEILVMKTVVNICYGPPFACNTAFIHLGIVKYKF
jgi:hypothetical protein